MCPSCPCQLRVSRKLSLRYHCSVFLLSSFVESLWGLANCRCTRSMWLLSHQGRVAGSVFSTRIRNIHQMECLWLNNAVALMKLYSHGPLSCSGWTGRHSIIQTGLPTIAVLEAIHHPRNSLGLLGTAEDTQLVSLWEDESTENLRKGMANVISPFPPPSWAACGCSAIVMA